MRQRNSMSAITAETGSRTRTKQKDIKTLCTCGAILGPAQLCLATTEPSTNRLRALARLTRVATAVTSLRVPAL